MFHKHILFFFVVVVVVVLFFLCHNFNYLESEPISMNYLELPEKCLLNTDNTVNKRCKRSNQPI